MSDLKSTESIGGLNSLRFFAFLSVLMYHSFPVCKMAYLGVDFFFIISSFLLTFLYFREVEQKGSFSVKHFFIRRSLRIYPLYFLVISLVFFVFPLLLNHNEISLQLPENKWYYLLFISNYEYSDHLFSLKFLWSISVEEQFYLLFILISFLFRKYFAAAILILFLGGIASVFMKYQYTSLPVHLFNFTAGMVLARYYYLNQKQNRLNLYLILLPVTFLLFFIPGLKESWFDLTVSLTFGLILLIVIQLFKYDQVKRFPVVLISEFLGKYTYGLYVYSGFVITLGMKFFVSMNLYLKFFLELGSLILLAMASYHVFEVRFLKLKEKFK